MLILIPFSLIWIKSCSIALIGRIATILTRATGIIRERRFEIGDVVKSDDALAIVDAPEIDRAVEAARANVEQAIARATNARSLSNRSSRLLKSEVVSEEESEQRQTAAVETAAAVRVAQAELARLEEQQRFSIVRAPFDGVISARNFDRGDHVRGDAASADGWLYQLERLDTLRFVINATPDLALRLARDNQATLHFGEFPGREFAARVAHSSRVFDTASGTMRMELLLENKDLAIPAGLTRLGHVHAEPGRGNLPRPDKRAHRSRRKDDGGHGRGRQSATHRSASPPEFRPRCGSHLQRDFKHHGSHPQSKCHVAGRQRRRIRAAHSSEVSFFIYKPIRAQRTFRSSSARWARKRSPFIGVQTIPARKKAGERNATGLTSWAMLAPKRGKTGHRKDQPGFGLD